MKRFTLFTLLYLAAGACLTAIALPSSAIAPRAKDTLLFEAGLMCVVAVLSTFPFWRQAAVRSQNRLRDQPAWRQNFVAIAPWLIIAATIVTSTYNLLDQNWTTGAIANAAFGLPIILLFAESIFARNQALR
ncbi:MAG: hypothetical protein ABI417_12310 [Coleofasciculaceae cyanobacterium]